MRDEFKQTKDYLRSLGNVNKCCMDIFGMLTNNEAWAEKMISESESTIEKLYAMDEDVKPGVWPTIIQELLDSVDYSEQLQQAYDNWIAMVSDGIRIYSEEDLNWLLGVKNISRDCIEPDSFVDRCCRLLTQNRNLMFALWCNIQDLKLEYNLHDTDDYNLSLAFRAFYNKVKYPNGPEDNEKRTIPDNVRMVILDRNSCEQFFDVDTKLSPTMWGKRLKKFAKPRKDWEKGYINNVFNYLTTIIPYLTEKNRCTFQKGTI